MDVINYAKLNSDGGVNTGILHGKDLALNSFTGLLVVPRGFEVPKASCTDWATFLAYLQDATLKVSANARLVPVWIAGYTDNTPEPTENTTGLGKTVGYTEKPSKLTFELENLGINYTKELMEFNNKLLSAYVVADNMVVGIETSTGLSASPCSIYKKKVKFANDKNTSDLMVTFENKDFLGKRVDFIEFPYEGYDMSLELSGLTEVVLSATGGSGKIDVKAIFKANENDFASEYVSEITQTSAWKCINASGTIVTPSAIGYNSTTGVISLSITAGTYTVKLADPADLVTATIGTKSKGGYIGNTLTGVVAS